MKLCDYNTDNSEQHALIGGRWSKKFTNRYSLSLFEEAAFKASSGRASAVEGPQEVVLNAMSKSPPSISNVSVKA